MKKFAASIWTKDIGDISIFSWTLKDIANIPIVAWTLYVFWIFLICFMSMFLALFLGLRNPILVGWIVFAVLVVRTLIIMWMQRRQQTRGWNDTLPPPDNGPDNFPGGSRVPRVPITPQLSGSEAKHLATPYVTYAHYYAFAETESEMRGGSNALWRRIENL